MTVPPPGDATPPPPPPPPPMPPSVPPTGGSGQSNGAATASLIMSIVSFFCLGPLLSIPAIFIGIAGKKKAQELGGVGEGQAKAGIIIGIISTVVSVIAIIIWIFLVVLASDSVDDAVRESNRALDELEESSQRDGEVADRDHFSIEDAEITDQTSFGSFTYKAYVVNEAPFDTGFDIDVECEGDAGDLDTQTVWVSNIREGGRKSFSAYFSFDDSNTTADCEVVEVRYAY